MSTSAKSVRFDENRRSKRGQQKEQKGVKSCFLYSAVLFLRIASWPDRFASNTLALCITSLRVAMRGARFIWTMTTERCFSLRWRGWGRIDGVVLWLFGY